MQSPGYAHRVKISNLQEMANTIIYVQEHGYNTQIELKNAFSESQKQLDQATDQLMKMNADLKNINRQIHYTGQYFSQKAIYTEFLKAKNKGRFRKEHTAEIQAYEEARDWLKSFYPDGKMLPIKTLKEQKNSLQEQIDQQKSSIRSLKDLTQDLRTVDKNVEAILHNQVPKKQKTREPELLSVSYTHLFFTGHVRIFRQSNNFTCSCIQKLCPSVHTLFKCICNIFQINCL